MDTIVLEMEQNGITFDNVVKIPKYLRDQRKHTIKGIKLLQPDFKPVDDIHDYSYDCHLLKNINLAQTRPDSSPAKDLFNLPELKERLSEQVQYEVRGDVVVKSIHKTDVLKSSVLFSVRIYYQEKYFCIEGSRMHHVKNKSVVLNRFFRSFIE